MTLRNILKGISFGTDQTAQDLASFTACSSYAPLRRAEEDPVSRRTALDLDALYPQLFVERRARRASFVRIAQRAAQRVMAALAGARTVLPALAIAIAITAGPAKAQSSSILQAYSYGFGPTAESALAEAYAMAHRSMEARCTQGVIVDEHETAHDVFRNGYGWEATVNAEATCEAL